MELRRCVVGPWSVNAFALVCPVTGQSVLIDPGAEPAELEKLLDGTAPRAVLLTHSHPDHIGALAEMRRRLKVPVMAHFGCADHGGIRADVRLRGGERLALGAGHLSVIHLPGHTADQLGYGIEADRRMIVGDAVFDGGPGRTWSARDFNTTLATLRDIVLAWPDDTICHPGHGARFRLGDIRGAIQDFVERDHGDFFGDATW